MKDGNHTIREATTLEAGTVAWVNCDLCVNFDYSAADPAVGADESVAVRDVWFEINGQRTEVGEYDQIEIETLCREWMSRLRRSLTEGSHAL